MKAPVSRIPFFDTPPIFRRRAAGRALLAAGCIVLIPYMAAAQEQPTQIPIELVIDQRHVGPIDALLAEGNVALDAAASRRYLAERVKPEVLDEWGIPAETAPGGYIGLQELTAAGLLAAFDHRLLELRIDVPAALRRPTSVSLRGTAGTEPAITDLPSRFSAYANLGSRFELGFGAPEARSAQLTVEPVLNLFNWVLEAGTTVPISPAGDPSYDYGRIVHDFPRQSVRCTAGTFAVPPTGFQAAYALEGICVTRDPSLMMMDRDRYLPGEEIFLARPAAVEVYVNDRLLQSMRLDAGTHRLLGFPYVSGLNHLRIEIAEEGASRRTVLRSVAFDGRLLDRGDIAFSASAGIPRWEAGRPVATGSFLYGIAPWVSAGLNVQAGADRQMAGAESILASTAGTVKADLGAAFDAFVWADWAVALQYRLYFPGRPRLPVFGAAARYQGARFLPPGEGAAGSPYSWEFNGTLSHTLPFGFGLTLGVGYRVSRVGQDVAAGSLTMLRSLDRGTHLLFNLSADFPAGSAPDIRAAVTVTSSPPGGRRTATFSTCMTDGDTYAEIQVRPGADPQALVLDGGAYQQPTHDGYPLSYRLGISYSGHRFEGSLTDTAYGEPGQGYGSLVVAQAATALVCAGGLWGISRPIADSFVMVTPHQNLSDQRVVVNPTGRDSAAVATARLPGILPQLRSYETSRIVVDAPEASPGYGVGNTVRFVRPSYKSGTVIRVGSVSTVYVEGSLFFQDGEPVRYAAGEVASAGGEPPVPFFTDEIGLFQAYDLPPGAYELYLSSRPAARISFTIFEGDSGLVQLGRLTLPATSREP